MIDFELTEDQLMMQKLARDFAMKEIAPVAAERDKIQDPAKCFPWDLVEKANAIGLRTLALSSEYGGGGQDSVTLCIVLEELAVADDGFAFIMQQQYKFCQMLQKTMTTAQAKKFLIPFAEDPKYLLALALVEPNHGTDNMLGAMDPNIKLDTTAVRDKDYVVINGVKDFISEADAAKLFVIFARTAKTGPIRDSTSAFLVPRDTHGLSIGRVMDKVGMRMSTNCEVILDNCRVPMENLVGEWDRGGPTVLAYLPMNGPYKAVCALGVARAAFEKAVEFAKTRVQGGKPIIEHPTISMALGEMWTEIQAARLMIWRAAWECDHDVLNQRWHRASKVFGVAMAMKVVLKALEIHGGYGPLKDVGVEKLARDILVYPHAGGTQDALLINLGTTFREGVGAGGIIDH